MPKYSDMMPPELAAFMFRGEAGNYILYDRHGGVYAGRQGPGVDRVGTHVRKRGRDLIAVQFMRDTEDDPCVRASRERSAVVRLVMDGYTIRNKVWPDEPRRCRVR